MFKNIGSFRSSDCYPNQRSEAFLTAFKIQQIAYFRTNEELRIEMLRKAIVDASANDEPLKGRCAAIFREAWLEDPVIDNSRYGTMFSLIERRYPSICGRDITDAILMQFGELMMTPSEIVKLASLTFPCMAYRGGSGPIDDVGKGRSWTLSLEKANFFAFEWAKRRQGTVDSIVLETKIGRENVVCYLEERDESEVILIPNL